MDFSHDSAIKVARKVFAVMNQTKAKIQSDRLAKRLATAENAKTLSLSDVHKTETLLENAASNPLGQLLNKVASMPEVRFEKVFSVRRQICQGKYGVDDKLNDTVDRILEDVLGF